jgi:hypothetical protein
MAGPAVKRARSICCGKIGAGEGNRTLVCSLGSRRVFKRFNILAVKLAPIHANAIKGISRACKTILAIFQMVECPLLDPQRT